MSSLSPIIPLLANILALAAALQPSPTPVPEHSMAPTAAPLPSMAPPNGPVLVKESVPASHTRPDKCSKVAAQITPILTPHPTYPRHLQSLADKLGVKSDDCVNVTWSHGASTYGVDRDHFMQQRHANWICPMVDNVRQLWKACRHDPSVMRCVVSEQCYMLALGAIVWEQARGLDLGCDWSAEYGGAEPDEYAEESKPVSYKHPGHDGGESGKYAEQGKTQYDEHSGYHGARPEGYAGTSESGSGKDTGYDGTRPGKHAGQDKTQPNSHLGYNGTQPQENTEPSKPGSGKDSGYDGTEPDNYTAYGGAKSDKYAGQGKTEPGKSADQSKAKPNKYPGQSKTDSGKYATQNKTESAMYTGLGVAKPTGISKAQPGLGRLMGAANATGAAKATGTGAVLGQMAMAGSQNGTTGHAGHAEATNSPALVTGAGTEAFSGSLGLVVGGMLTFLLWRFM